MKISRKSKRDFVFAFTLITIMLIVLTSSIKVANAKQVTTVCSTQKTLMNSQETNIPIDFFEITATGDHKLTIQEYSHLNQPIYPNYTQVNFAVAFEGDEYDMSTVTIHYSSNNVNWTSVEFVPLRTLSINSTLFGVTIGPFVEIGEYSVKINATRFSVEHAAIYFLMPVVEITGLIFVDFGYKIIELENKTEFVNLQVTVLGDNLLNNSVKAFVDQIDYNSTDMALVEGTTNRYNATMGSIMHWEEYVHVTFSANTTTGSAYNNSNFLFHKKLPRFAEPFLTSLLPAILVGVLVVGSMSTIFVMAKRRAPKKFDIETSDDSELKEQLRKKMRREKRKKKDKEKKKEEELF